MPVFIILTTEDAVTIGAMSNYLLMSQRPPHYFSLNFTKVRLFSELPLCDRSEKRCQEEDFIVSVCDFACSSQL